MAMSDERREEFDATLAALYRRVSVEETPHHLDRAIAAEARRPIVSEPSRAGRWSVWRVSFVAAAVAVISASLIAVMTEQPEEPRAFESSSVNQPDPERPAVKTEPTAREARPEAEASRAANAPPARRREQSDRRKPEVPDKPSRDVLADATPAPLERRERTDPTRLPQNQAAEVPAAAPPASPPAPTARVQERTPATATAPSQPEQAAKAMAKPPTAARSAGPASALPATSPAASHIVELEGRPPAHWLERILYLRRVQRDTEADALLAEFKSRYPNERLPAEVSGK